MTSQKKQLVAGAILLLAITCGAWVAGRASVSTDDSQSGMAEPTGIPGPAASTHVPTQQVDVAESGGGTEELAELKRELADALAAQSNLLMEREALQREYAVLDAELSRMKAAAEEEEKRRSERNDQRRRGFDGYMERLKEEDPKRYAEMQERRQEMRSQMQRQTAERAAFLLDVDTSNMSPEQLENHELLVNSVAEAFQMMDALNKGEETNVSRHEMFERMHVIGDLYETERDYLLEQTARNLGFAEEDTEVFANHIKEVYEMTSVRGIFRGGRSGRGERGGRDRTQSQVTQESDQ